MTLRVDARNKAAGRCVNETRRGDHGPATFGCRCRRCYAIHAGVPLEQVPLVYTPGRTGRVVKRRLRVDAKTYRYLDATARARGVSIRQVADEVIGTAIDEEVSRN